MLAVTPCSSHKVTVLSLISIRAFFFPPLDVQPGKNWGFSPSLCLMVFKIKHFIACVGALFLVVSKFPTMAHKHIRTCLLSFIYGHEFYLCPVLSCTRLMVVCTLSWELALSCHVSLKHCTQAWARQLGSKPPCPLQSSCWPTFALE